MFSYHSSIVIFGVLSVIPFSVTILIDPYLNDIAQAINFEFRRDSYQRSLGSNPPIDPKNPITVVQDSYGSMFPAQDQILGDGSNIVETIVLPPTNLELEKLNEVEPKTDAPKTKIKDLFLEKSLNASGDLDRLKLVKRVLEQKSLMKENGTVIVTPTPQFQSEPKVTHSVSKSVKIVIGVPSVPANRKMVGSSSKMRSSPPTSNPFLTKTTTKQTPRTTTPQPDTTKVSKSSPKTTRSSKRRTSIETTSSKNKKDHKKLRRKKLMKKTIRRKDGPREGSKFTHFPALPTKSRNTLSRHTKGHANLNALVDKAPTSFSPSPTIPSRYHETTLPTTLKKLVNPTTAEKVSELLVADPYDNNDFTSEDERIQVAKDYEPLVVPDPLPVPPPPSPIAPLPTSAYSSTRFEKLDFPTSTTFLSFPTTKFQPSRDKTEPTPVEYLQEQTLANILGISQVLASRKPEIEEAYPTAMDLSQFNSQVLSSHAPFYGDVIEEYDDYYGNDGLKDYTEPFDNKRVVKSIEATTPFQLVDDLDSVTAPKEDSHFEPTFRPPIKPLPLNPNREANELTQQKEKSQNKDTLGGPDLRNFPRFPYNELQELDAKAFSHLAKQYHQVQRESSGPEFDFDPSNYELTFGSLDSMKNKERFRHFDEDIASKFDHFIENSEENEEENFSAPPAPIPSVRSIPMFRQVDPPSKKEESVDFAYNYNDYSDEPHVPDYGDKVDHSDIYSPMKFVQTQSFFPRESGIQVPDIKSHNFPGIVRHVSTYSRSIPFPSSNPDVEHVVDFGAASGDNGAFGWYSDSPVGRRK